MVWTPDSGAQPLVQPDSGFVNDLRTDGKWLFWVVAEGERVLDFNPGTVWASPLKFDAEELKPRRLGDVSRNAPSYGHHVAGAGYYVAVEGSLSDGNDTHELHVFRASDRHHWLVPKPDGVQSSPPSSGSASTTWWTANRRRHRPSS